MFCHQLGVGHRGVTGQPILIMVQCVCHISDRSTRNLRILHCKKHVYSIKHPIHLYCHVEIRYTQSSCAHQYRTSLSQNDFIWIWTHNHWGTPTWAAWKTIKATNFALWLPARNNGGLTDARGCSACFTDHHTCNQWINFTWRIS